MTMKSKTPEHHRRGWEKGSYIDTRCIPYSDRRERRSQEREMKKDQIRMNRLLKSTLNKEN